MQQFKRGDIWLAKLHSDGVGSEQKGKYRPVLITQNNIGNKYSKTYTIVPLSSVLKKLNMPTHALLSNTKCLEKLSIALAEQINTLSEERFLNYIGKVDWNDMKKVENAIMIHNGIAEEYNNEVI